MELVVIGGGTQGSLIAHDLASRPEVQNVQLADIRHQEMGGQKVDHVICDVRRAPDVAQLLKDAEAVVLALPGELGQQALQNVLPVGIPVVDISFTPQDLRGLNTAAKDSGTTAIVDCGVAPGLSHILAGAAHHEMGGLDELVIHVGGMPVDPPEPFLHAVYFHPEDLLAEYTRLARQRKDGRDIAPTPLSERPTLFMDDEMGEHESFASDGLRTLLSSYPDVPNMVERTLRRRGHLDFMQRLRSIGALSDDPRTPGEDPQVRSTARNLSKLYPGIRHPDYILLHVEASNDGEKRCWRLLDFADGGFSAMARSTGYTAASVAIRLAEGRFSEAGIHPPERLGHQPNIVDILLSDLAARGVRITSHSSHIRPNLAQP